MYPKVPHEYTRLYPIVPDCTRLYYTCTRFGYFWVLLGIFRCRKYPNVPECTPNVPECTPNVPECTTNVPECTTNVPECTVVLLWYFCSTAVVLFAMGDVTLYMI